MKKQVKAIFIPSINFQNNQDVHHYFNLGIYSNGGRQRHELYIIDESRSQETINDYVYCSDLGPQKAYTVLPSVKETDHLIIGTTDKVLIDDGVPPISPEFIEEFFQTGFMCIPFVEIVENPKINYDGTLALTTTIQTNTLINNQIEKQENNTINAITNSAGEQYKNGFKAGVEWHMKKKTYVIILHTRDTLSPIWIEDVGENTYYIRKTIRNSKSSSIPDNVLGSWHSRRHIYFVSDDEIKESDWYYVEHSKKIVQYFEQSGIFLFREGIFKIVASTDPSLGLPSIPQQWIDEVFVPSNGLIKEVDLELEQHYNSKYGASFRLKLYSDDVCIINDIKTSIN